MLRARPSARPSARPPVRIVSAIEAVGRDEKLPVTISSFVPEPARLHEDKRYMQTRRTQRKCAMRTGRPRDRNGETPQTTYNSRVVGPARGNCTRSVTDTMFLTVNLCVRSAVDCYLYKVIRLSFYGARFRHAIFDGSSAVDGRRDGRLGVRQSCSTMAPRNYPMSTGLKSLSCPS